MFATQAFSVCLTKVLYASRCSKSQ